MSFTALSRTVSGAVPSGRLIVRYVRLGLVNRLISRPAQGSSGTLLGDLAVEHNRPAINENIFNSHRVPKRILVGGNILYRRGVKDRNIRHHPRTQDPAIHESHSAGGQRG